MRMIGLTALLALGLGTPALAGGATPEDYQGVWAAARDCRSNFQNILSNVVDREFASCRIMQVLSSGRPGVDLSTVTLNCGGAQSREVWHGETIDGSDYLVVIRLDKGAAASSVDLYKRCPGIPLAEIPLSTIPGNPTASEETIAPPPRGSQNVSKRQPSHSRATRLRRHAPH